MGFAECVCVCVCVLLFSVSVCVRIFAFGFGIFVPSTPSFSNDFHMVVAGPLLCSDSLIIHYSVFKGQSGLVGMLLGVWVLICWVPGPSALVLGSDDRARGYG